MGVKPCRLLCTLRGCCPSYHRVSHQNVAPASHSCGCIPRPLHTKTTAYRDHEAVPTPHMQVQKTLFCLDQDGAAITRVWCLFEIYHTVKARGAEGLEVITYMMPNLKPVFDNLDVRNAKASESNGCG
jgi:hypothetical protein